jgi:MFS family permease
VLVLPNLPIMTGELHHDDVEAGHGSSEIHSANPQPYGPGQLELERTPTAQHSEQRPGEKIGLARVESAFSAHDIHGVPSHASSYVEVNAAQYERFSPRKKIIITCVLSLCGFLAPISSTTILAAIPEVAATYNTTGSIINLSNALYLIFMGLSPTLWGPISTIYGRRWCCIITAVLFFAFSIGTALAPNLASYFIFRVLTAYQGTAFLIVGTSCLGDIYTPTARATALSWFLSGTLIGPAFGPFIGGIIVTFRTWRDIFWLQTALGGLAAVMVVFLLPETIPEKKIDELKEYSPKQRTLHILHWISPFRVAILLFSYPNLIIAGLASSSLVWNMYSLVSVPAALLPPFHHPGSRCAD